MTVETRAPRVEIFHCAGPADIDLELRTGEIAVRATDQSDVRVEISLADVDGAANGSPSDTRVVFAEAERKLVVRGPRSHDAERLRVAIEAPVASALVARIRRGNVSTEGPLSTVTAATGAGALSIGQASGPLEAATGRGDVTLGQVTDRVRARTGAGELAAGELRGAYATFASGRGSITIGTAACDLRLRSGRGDLVVDEVEAGSLNLATGHGDVRIGLAPGLAAKLDLASGSGEVRTDLSRRDQPPAGSVGVQIRVRTGQGDIVVGAAAS